MNPLTESELLELLHPVALRPGARTVDLAGGRADLSRLLATRFQCVTTSVDVSPAACDAARERTSGLPVEVLVMRAEDHVARQLPNSFALASVIGAIHAFGSGIVGFRKALRQLAPLATHVLLADLVALGARAARAFDVTPADELDHLFGKHVVSFLHLGPERVAAYEQAWCGNLAAYLAAHPGDPREAWARERIAWSAAPDLRAARTELGFRAFVLRSRA